VDIRPQHNQVFVCGSEKERLVSAFGRLVAHEGLLEAIWPYSGHYHPTEENFREFISFLREHHVDLTNVKVLIVHLHVTLKLSTNGTK